MEKEKMVEPMGEEIILHPGATAPYVPLVDRKKPLNEQGRFMLTSLSPTQSRDMVRMMGELKPDLAVTGSIQLAAFDFAIDVCHIGVVSWGNLRDKFGNISKLESRKGKEDIDLLTPGLIRELSVAILEYSGVNMTPKKDDGSQQLPDTTSGDSPSTVKVAEESSLK